MSPDDGPQATPATPSSKTDRRHPLVVTSERLADHATTYHRHITPAEQDELSQLAELVDRIHRRVTGGDPS